MEIAEEGKKKGGKQQKEPERQGNEKEQRGKRGRKLKTREQKMKECRVWLHIVLWVPFCPKRRAI